MYLSGRMQIRGYAVYRQGLAEVLQIYKVERKTYMNPCPKFIRFGRDCNNLMTPQGLKLSSPAYAGKYFSKGFKNSKVYSSPPNPWFNLPSWGRWVIGSAISIVLSFLNSNWMKKLKHIEGEVVMAVEGVEAVAEMVEKVATGTEEIAKEMEENLHDESKLKQVALVLETISEVAAHEAHLTNDFLRKVEKFTQDFDDLETVIKPLVDKIVANTETKHEDGESKSESESPSHY